MTHKPTRYDDDDSPTLIFVEDDPPSPPNFTRTPSPLPPSRTPREPRPSSISDHVIIGITEPLPSAPPSTPPAPSPLPEISLPEIEIDLSDLEGPTLSASTLEIEITDDDPTSASTCWHPLRSSLDRNPPVGDYRIVGRRMLLRIVNEPYQTQILELGWPIVSTHTRRQTAHAGSAIAISAPGILEIIHLLQLDATDFVQLVPVPKIQPLQTQQTQTPQTTLQTSAPDETEVRTGAILLPHQREGVAWLRAVRWGLLADDLGLGKTIQVLAALEREPDVHNILFITPSSMQLQWAKEARTWAPSFEIITPAGGAAAREVLAAFFSPAAPSSTSPKRGIVLTWDLLAPLEEVLAAIPWDVLVTDEQHLAKTLGAKRTQALLSIAFAIPIRWFATGTPMLNRALELWPLLHLCDPERFSHPQSYIDRFCGESGRLSCHPDELRETLKPYLLRRLKSLLNLPEQSEERLTVRPSTRPPHDARQILEELRDAHRGGDGIPARAMKALAEVRQWVATEKAKQAIPWIEEHVSTSDPIVVFFTHKATHDILKRGLKALTLYDPSLQTERPLRVASIVGGTAKKKRQAYKEAFEAGLLDVILGSEAARDGITLVRARFSLHVERWYTPEAESQAKGRIHRIGQTRDVTNVTMHLEDGYDDWIDGLVTAKSKTIRRVIDG